MKVVQKKHCHALLSIHVTGGQRSVRIASPSLLITVVQQPETSSPLSQLKRSSTGVIWMCKASFTNSSCPLPCMAVTLMTTGAFSQNVCKLFSELKLVTDNLSLFMQQPTEKPLKVSLKYTKPPIFVYSHKG